MTRVRVFVQNKDVALTVFHLRQEEMHPSLPSIPQLGFGSALAQVDVILKLQAFGQERRGNCEEWRDFPVSWTFESLSLIALM